LQKKIDDQAEEILMEKFMIFCACLSKQILIIISDLSRGGEEKYDYEDKDKVSC
jgi:hypothetical protein